MRKHIFDFLLDDKGNDLISDNKLIVFLTFVVASIVLAFATYQNHEQLDIIFISYCLIFSGLKVSKGVIDTMQKKIKHPQQEKQND